jgi:hypothetical protein
MDYCSYGIGVADSGIVAKGEHILCHGVALFGGFLVMLYRSFIILCLISGIAFLQKIFRVFPAARGKKQDAQANGGEVNEHSADDS